MRLTYLALIRRAKGFSQAELGRRAQGLQQSYVSALERGLQITNTDHVRALADALGVEPEALTTTRLTVSTSPGGQVEVFRGL